MFFAEAECVLIILSYFIAVSVLTIFSRQ